MRKKSLIRRMALAAAAVLAVALAGVLLTLVKSRVERREREKQARVERAAALDGARAHLDEVAQSITTVPVDPAVVAEIEAAYFAESRERRRVVWATDPDGGFLFGIPREDFARLNRLWDDHQDVLGGEGGYVDRQDFLRQLVHASEDVPALVLNESYEEPRELRQALRQRTQLWHWSSLSTPLRADDGSALGSLYLQLETPPARSSGDLEDATAVLGAASGLSFVFLWFLLPTWVFVDARERGMPRAPLWSFLVLISFLLGLVVYLVARPEPSGPLQCPSCRREVDAHAYCPHCGHDLSRAFCSACRFPLAPGWSFCPSCRTEIRQGDDAGDAGALVSQGG